MSVNAKLAVAYRNAGLDLILASAASGFVDVYDGVQPADADTAVTTQNLLVRLPLSSTPFSASSGGVAAITTGGIGSAAITTGGNPTWYRLTDASHVAIRDGSAGASGCNLNFTVTTLAAGAIASVASYTETFPA